MEALQSGKLLVREYPFEASSRVILRPQSLSSDGAFFFGARVGEQGMGIVLASMNTQGRRIEAAKSYL